MLKSNKKITRLNPFQKAWSFWKESRLWTKIWTSFLIVCLLFVGSMYGIAQWYIHKHSGEPLKMGVSFVPNYARRLGVDPQETMQAMINDLGVRQFRLVSYWEDIETEPGKYDFSEMDWQFAMVEAVGAKVSLSIGLRQPRWPECHMPKWVSGLPQDQKTWLPQLKDVMRAIIERYRSSPALESYQLENEYFNTVFGICKDFDRSRLVDEYNFAKNLDPNHKVIVSRSNNAVGTPIGQPTPDEYAVSVYKRVWDKNVTKRYFEYPFPAWFYGFLAGTSEIIKGKDMLIHELQAEPWLPDEFNIVDAPLDEMYKSLTPERLEGRFIYGKATGMREIYLWGAEWWYQMKTTRNTPEFWDTAKAEFRKVEK